MADFCMQCAIATFGEDNGDLAGLIAAHRVALGFVATAMCEGCGPTFVDHTGRCVNKHCTYKHGATGEVVDVIPVDPPASDTDEAR